MNLIVPLIGGIIGAAIGAGLMNVNGTETKNYNEIHTDKQSVTK